MRMCLTLHATGEEARREARLRAALARGAAPAAPDLWAATPEELRAEGVLRSADAHNILSFISIVRWFRIILTSTGGSRL